MTTRTLTRSLTRNLTRSLTAVKGAGGITDFRQIPGLVRYNDANNIPSLGTSGSRDFDRADAQFYNVPDDPVFNHSGPIGGCSYIKKNVDATVLTIQSKTISAGNQREFILSIRADNVLRIGVSVDGLTFINLEHTTIISSGVWSFVAWWFDSVSQLLYLIINNGLPVSFSISAIFQGTADVRIGAFDGVTIETFDGNMQNAVLFIPPTPIDQLMYGNNGILARLYNGGNVPDLQKIKNEGLFTTWGVQLASPLNGRKQNEVDISDNAFVLTGNGTVGTPAEDSGKPNDKVLNLRIANPQPWLAVDSSANANDGILNNFPDDGETSRSTDIIAGGSGTSLPFDGVDQFVQSLTVGSITAVEFKVKSVIDNQILLSIQGTTLTAVSVVAGVLTFGGTLSESNIEVDDVIKTPAEAGALINDNTWHKVTFDLVSISGTDFRLATDGTSFGNILLDDVKLNAGVLLDWGFDEADGYSNDGTIVKAAADPSEDSTYNPNSDDIDIDFDFLGDGAERLITLENASIPITSNYTIIVIVKAPTSATFRHIKSDGNTGTSALRNLHLNDSDVPRFFLRDDAAGVTIDAVASEAIPDNVETMLIGDFDGLTARIFINGVEKGSDTGTLGTASLNESNIAASSADISWLNGNVWKVATYNRLLITQEITDFNAGLIPPGFTDLWIADKTYEPSGNTVIDGGPLNRWRDLSKKVNHYDNPGVLSRPTWNAGPVAPFVGAQVSFDGVDDFMQSLLTQDFPLGVHCFIRGNWAVDSSTIVIEQGPNSTSGNSGWRIVKSNTADLFNFSIFDGVSSASAAITAAGDFQIIEGRSDLVNTIASSDGVDGTPVAQVLTTAGGLQISNIGSRDGVNFTDFQCDLVVVYDHQLTDSERAAVLKLMGIIL